MKKFFGMIATLAAVGIPTIASASECIQVTIQRPDLAQATADPMFPAREPTIQLSVFGATKEEVDACNKGNSQSSVTGTRPTRIEVWTMVRAKHPFGQGATLFLPATPNAAGMTSRQITVTAPTCLQQGDVVSSAKFGMPINVTSAISGKTVLLEDVSNRRHPREVTHANKQCADLRTAQK